MILFLGLFAINSCVVLFPETRYKNLTNDQNNSVVVCHFPVNSFTNLINILMP